MSPPSLLARFLIALIRGYQRAISPLLGPVCRFEPSCSRYAAACIAGHGALRGGLLSIRRLCKCHPFHPGGFDPPPPSPLTPPPPPASTDPQAPPPGALLGARTSDDALAADES